MGEDTWYTNSISNLKFRSTADYEKFQYIEVDGIQIEKENYTSYEGSTYVELFPSFLKTLSVGKHSLGIFSADGSGTADFFIKKHETSSGSSSYVIPKTGIE